MYLALRASLLNPIVFPKLYFLFDLVLIVNFWSCSHLQILNFVIYCFFLIEQFRVVHFYLCHKVFTFVRYQIICRGRCFSIQHIQLVPPLIKFHFIFSAPHPSLQQFTFVYFLVSLNARKISIILAIYKLENIRN